jgi:hypothetical protein
VSNDAELRSAITKMKAGGTILLENGVQFTEVKMLGNQFDSLLTFKPRDPLGVKPKFKWLIARQVRNVMFDMLAVNVERYTGVELSGENVTLQNSIVNGGYALKGNPDLKSYRSGISAGGKSISLLNNDISRTGTGIGVGGVIGLQVIGNKIYETIQDCMNVGSNTQDAVIAENTFMGQPENPKTGHHPDLLQFWCQVDATMDTKNVKILRNRFIAPDEAVTPQSIFGRADYGTNPYKFQDFEIAYNMIYSRQANAIRFAEGDNFDVHHNVLTHAGVDPWTSPTVTLPGILLQMVTNYKIHHNIFPSKYGYPAVDTPEFYKNVVYKFPV